MRNLALAIVAGAALFGAAHADPHRDESGRDRDYCYDGRCDGRRYGGSDEFIPRGHLPPPGRCRVWFDDRPPGQQPPPTSCSRARRLAERYGALVVTSRGRVFDPYYDRRY